MTGFSLQTLGFPEIHSDNRLTKLNLRKGLALLIYLAEAQGAVARDVIATLLWPESPRETARARLRRMLHRIEVTLGQHIFETDRTSVRWSPAVELKVNSHLFESACDRGAFEEACLRYRGDFLAGFSLDDCPEFDDWAFFRREALRGRLMQGLERLVQEKNAAGEHFAATAHAGRLVELDPLSEVYCRHLIRSLLLAGDRSSAERRHAALTQRLRDDLGVAPEAATEALMDPTMAPVDAVPTTLYVKGAGAHLAYQTYGTGELDILIMPGFVSHVERLWEHPSCRAFLVSLMALGQLILFDRRGIGLSDRVGSAPSVEVTAEDIGVVLRAAHTRRVVLFGASDAGRHASSLRSTNPASWLASFCLAHWPRAVGRRTIHTRCRQANMTPGASSSSPNGVALPGSKLSGRAFLVIPKRGPGGPGCCARPLVPAAFGPCSRRCATPM